MGVPIVNGDLKAIKKTEIERSGEESRAIRKTRRRQQPTHGATAREIEKLDHQGQKRRITDPIGMDKLYAPTMGRDEIRIRRISRNNTGIKRRFGVCRLLPYQQSLGGKVDKEGMEIPATYVQWNGATLPDN